MSRRSVLPPFAALLIATKSEEVKSQASTESQDCQSTPPDQTITASVPQAPKRPVSSYFKYMSEQRAALKPLNLSPKDLKERIQQGWKDLSEQDKQVLKEACRVEMEAFKAEHGPPIKPPTALELE